MRPSQFFRILPFIVLASLMGGCGKSKSPQNVSSPSEYTRVWPTPPESARIAFVRFVQSPADLEVKEPWTTRLSSFFTGKNALKEPFVKPFALFVDETGNLCLTDTGTNFVFYFQLSQKRYKRFSQVGPYTLLKPVAVAKRGDVMYVADTGHAAVLVFDIKGRFQFAITEKLKRPAGVTIIGDKIYVADALQHAVQVFDAKGQWLFQIGERGSKVAQFNFPTHVTTDGGGNLLVNDSMNGRVQVFSEGGKYQSVVGEWGDGSGYFSRPKSVAVDPQGRLYVTDALFDNFQIFDGEGRFLLHVGSAGSGVGEFWMPVGIAINDQKEIYVADPYNSRIQVFRYVGEP